MFHRIPMAPATSMSIALGCWLVPEVNVSPVTALSEYPRTILVDDHPLFRAGVRALLSRTILDVVGEANDGSEALAAVARLRPELLFVDVKLPDTDGASLTALLRDAHPECRVIGLSAIDEPVQIAQMLRAGAHGYVLKTEAVAAMAAAVQQLRRGERYLPACVSREQIESLTHADSVIDQLTARELEVFEQLVDGQSNDAIASALFISVRTVETHRQRIMRKLDVHSIIELVRLGARHGLSRP